MGSSLAKLRQIASDANMTETNVQNADPTAPYVSDAEDEPRRWHVVFGILCAAYGGIGLCFYGLALLIVILGPWLSKLAGRTIGTPPSLFWINILQTTVPMILGGMLLYGGIELLRRRPRGYRLVIGWAAARLVFAVIQLTISVVTIDLVVTAQVDQYEAQMAQLSAGDREKAETSMRAFGIEPPTVESVRKSAPKWIGIMIGAVALWPLVLGIALTSKRSRNDVAGWSTERREVG